MQGFGREVRHDNFISSLDEPVGNGLADLNAGDALHGWRNALDVLHVHGGEHIDIRVEQVENVLVALAVLAALDVRVGKLVDQDDLRFAGKDAVEVHLFEDDALVLNLLPRNLLQLLGELSGARSTVGFDYADHDVLAALVPPNCFAQHIVGFAYAWRVTEE